MFILLNMKKTGARKGCMMKTGNLNKLLNQIIDISLFGHCIDFNGAFIKLRQSTRRHQP